MGPILLTESFEDLGCFPQSTVPLFVRRETNIQLYDIKCHNRSTRLFFILCRHITSADMINSKNSCIDLFK